MVLYNDLLGTGVLSVLLAMGALALVLFLAVYVYTALALMTIGKKLKYKNSWLAWIPLANVAMILQLGSFHWAWVFLLLIPILGWLALSILCFIAMWRIYERRKYSGWLALIPLLSVVPVLGSLAGIAHLVVMGLVAWRDQ